MSLRSLTTRLQEESVELSRRHQFDQSRSRTSPRVSQQPQQTAQQRQTAFMSASGKRNAPNDAPRDVMPVFKPSAKRVGLRVPDQTDASTIPGGIAAKFGRHTLQEPKQVNHVQKAELPAEKTPATPVKPQADIEKSNNVEPQRERKPEREAEPEEAARITIELQSH